MKVNKKRSCGHIINIGKIGRIVAAMLCLCIAFASTNDLFVPVEAALSDATSKSLEAKIAKIEEDMKSLQKKISSSQKSIEDAISTKQNLDSQVKLFSEKIELTEKLIEQYTVALSNTEAAISERERLYEEKYETFKTRLRVTHEDGNISYLEMIFGSESLSDFLSRIERIGAMMEYDSQIMNQLETERKGLEDDHSSYEQLKKEQDEQLAALEADKAELEKKSAEAIELLASLQRDKKYYEALEAENERRSKELEAELSAYLKELEEKQNSKYVGGTFLWPVPTTYTRVSSECGWRSNPITGKREFHNGMDIPAPLGTDVYAANDGTVIIATEHWSYGNYVMIDHGGGISTLYAHNSKLCVKVGDKVKRGDVIAKVGSTGASTGNHCHFSVWKGGYIINPREYFPK